MGHEDIRTTYNIYGHLFEDDEGALVERLDQMALAASQRRGVGDLLGVGSAEVIPLPSVSDERRSDQGKACGPERSRTADLTRARGGQGGFRRWRLTAILRVLPGQRPFPADTHLH
jgi:hypothetical protein